MEGLGSILPADVETAAIPVRIPRHDLMPFSFRKAGHSFQRFMDDVLQDLIRVFIYIVVRETPSSLDDLFDDPVLQQLRDHVLIILPEKCLLAISSLAFLTQELSAKGTLPSSEKVATN